MEKAPEQHSRREFLIAVGAACAGAGVFASCKHSPNAGATRIEIGADARILEALQEKNGKAPDAVVVMPLAEKGEPISVKTPYLEVGRVSSLQNIYGYNSKLFPKCILAVYRFTAKTCITARFSFELLDDQNNVLEVLTQDEALGPDRDESLKKRHVMADTRWDRVRNIDVQVPQKAAHASKIRVSIIGNPTRP